MNRIPLMALVASVMLALCGTARAQAPVAGQPYQVPPGYEAYGAGTLISYGGFNYVAQGNGTMLLAQQADAGSTDPGPADGQPYQVPAGFEGYGAGTLISYGGFNYVIQGDGTMLLAQDSGGSSDGGDGLADGDATDDQPYQVPAGYESYGAGTLIGYGGLNYVIQGNGTMLLAGGGGRGGRNRNPASVGRGSWTQTRGPGRVVAGRTNGTRVRGGGPNVAGRQVRNNGGGWVRTGGQVSTGSVRRGGGGGGQVRTGGVRRGGGGGGGGRRR